MLKLVASSVGFFISITIAVISYIGMWKCFEKTGEKGWKAIIPFYNYMILYKISGMNPYWAILNLSTWIFNLMEKFAQFSVNTYLIFSAIIFGLTIFELVITILLIINFCHSFNKGGGYIAGMFFLAPIFYMIIGFGDAQYIGPKGIKKEENVNSEI